MNIGVFGSSLPAEADPSYQEGLELGREIARRGARVVCGGYGGVMEAVCRGAAEAGGASIGVVLEGRGVPNAWVRERVMASDLGERLRILRDSTDAWIFLPRGLGTMLELVWIAESVVKAEAPPRPFVLVGPYWRALVEMAIAEAASPGGLAALRSAVHFEETVFGAAAAAMSAAPGKP